MPNLQLPSFDASEDGSAICARNSPTRFSVSEPNAESWFSLAKDSGGRDLTTSRAVLSTSLHRVDLGAPGNYMKYEIIWNYMKLNEIILCQTEKRQKYSNYTTLKAQEDVGSLGMIQKGAK